MAYNVNALSTYVKENEKALIKDVVLGLKFEGSTIDKLAKQLGVKSKENIHPMSVDPILQDGSNCGFTASGSTDISEREIATAPIKYNDQWCDRDLLAKFAENQVRLEAGEEVLPFEAEITDGIVKGISKKMEKLVWQGSKTGGDLIDGFLTIAEGADSGATITGATATGASVYAAVKEAVMAIPDELIDNAVVFVSPSNYRAFVDELVEKNLYHFAPDAKQEDVDVTFPGTDVKIHKTYGLSGVNNKIYASAYENMVYGADMLNAKEVVKMWYSDDDDLFKAKVLFNAGVQTIYPDMVVVITKN